VKWRRTRPEPHDSGANGMEEFDLPTFDERAAQRAIRRGVIRTAVSALVLLIVGYYVLLVAASLWQSHGDRKERFPIVAGLGFLVANPGYNGYPSGCCNQDLTSIELFLDVAPRAASQLTPTTSAWLRLNILGRIVIDSIPRLPVTPVDLGFRGLGRPDKAQTRTVLGDLPRRMVATAIIEQTKPTTAPAFKRLLRRDGVAPQPGVGFAFPPVAFEPLYDPLRLAGRLSDEPLVWPNTETAGGPGWGGKHLPRADSVTQFKRWATMLRQSDDRNLGRLGLPSSQQIKAVAAQAEIHGFILEKASLKTLRRLLADPAVRSVKIVDVAFGL
jgi:hypothetical protein